MGKLAVMAIVLDVLYQLMVFRRIYPVEAIDHFPSVEHRDSTHGPARPGNQAREADMALARWAHRRVHGDSRSRDAEA